ALTAMKYSLKGEEITVPNLIGKDLGVAFNTSSMSGLNLKVERSEPNTAISKNHIISQDPLPGKAVKRGRIIGVVVSQGFKESAVPNMTGQNLKTAEEKLKEEGLNTGEIIGVHKEGTPEGTIIAQSPLGMAMVEQGRKVDLLVSLGPPTKIYLMPDLTGMRYEEVQKLIKNYGLKMGQVIQREVDNREPNSVINQEPKPGSRVEEGQEISLTVVQASSQVRGGSSSTFALLLYQVPFGMPSNQLVVRVQNRLGEKEIFNDQKRAGETIRLMIAVEGETVASIYLNGTLVQERKY
ncbi:MAG: PASTA domain-containing protein, partial [Candidatus Tectomicrobia bacterium]|nr:PASTA domain-containing protein [Candidatus Tectomicrobia bacterium]